MGEYFKPWRRKIGVLTLVAACVCMNAWLRSTTGAIDAVVISVCGLRSVFISGSQKFRLVFYRNLPVQMATEIETPTGRSLTVVNFGEGAFESGIISYYPFTGRLFGIRYENDEYFNVMMFPYWFIVVPLTLASIWLLLVKPRSSHQQKICEPTPEMV